MKNGGSFHSYVTLPEGNMYSTYVFWCNSFSETSPGWQYVYGVQQWSTLWTYAKLVQCQVVLLDIHIVLWLWMPAPRIEIEAYPEVFVGYNG